MRILAFDPGKTTGFCEAIVDPTNSNIQIVNSCTLAWERRFFVHELLQGTCEAPLPDVVVVESFHLYAHKAQELIGSIFPSVQIIGTLEAYAFELGIIDRIVYQPASVMSRVELLEYGKLLAPSPHARDAFKHLRYYVVMNIKRRK